MEDQILLAHLQALLGRSPDFSQFSPESTEHQAWLGQAYALIVRWNQAEAGPLRTAPTHLASALFRDHAIAQIYGVINRAIADLELRVPDDQKHAFGPGEVYDFFNAFRRVIESAEDELLIIDPYLDAPTLEQYLHARQDNTQVALLVNRYAGDVKTALERYNQQYGDFIAARRSAFIHDRIVFVDREVCWVIGQSIKDAAKAKPTYLAPLAPDVALTKLQHYEAIWLDADAI